MKKKDCRLQTLSLQYNAIGIEGGEMLFREAGTSQTLSRLYMSGNFIPKEYFYFKRNSIQQSPTEQSERGLTTDAAIKAASPGDQSDPIAAGNPSSTISRLSYASCCCVERVMQEVVVD